MDKVDILVVEDNPDEARMTLRVIAGIKPPVTFLLATDGEDALKMLIWEKRCNPALILLDLKLPKIHGLDVLRALKEDSECKSIPVVVFSSSAEPKDTDMARSWGANDYVCKPIEWDDYSKVISDVVAKFLSSQNTGG